MKYVISLVVIIVLIILAVRFFDNENSKKPWWSGTSVQKVCEKHNLNNTNCYNLAVTAEEGQVLQIAFPDAGYVLINSTFCDKAITFEGRYCVVTDESGRTWQINSN